MASFGQFGAHLLKAMPSEGAARQGAARRCRRALRLGPLLAAILLAGSSAQAGFRLVHDRGVSSSQTVMEVVERPAGGYAIAAGSPMFLLQTDAAGTVLSTRTYNADAAVSIDVTADGGFVLAGERRYDTDEYLVVKTNAAGNVAWSHAFTSFGRGRGVHSIRELAAGGFIASGILTLRLDAAGAQVWSEDHLGNSGHVNCIRETSDGGFVAASDGVSGSFPPNLFAIVSRLASDGSVIWNRALYGSADDGAAAVAETSDAGFMVAGTTTSFGVGGNDGFLARFDTDGLLLWALTYGTPGDDAFSSLTSAGDGGFVVAGRFDSRLGLMRVDANGALAWARSYPATADSSGGRLHSVIMTSATSFVAAGVDEIGRVVLLEADANGDLGGCFQMDPALSVASAAFSVADAPPEAPASLGDPPVTTTATGQVTRSIDCGVRPNRPPTCEAGSNRSHFCDPVELSEASMSDPDGDVLAVSWTAACPGAIFTPSADVLNPSIDFDASCVDTCLLTLTVSDGYGGTATDTASVLCFQDGLDCDRDGVVHSSDCAPNDGGAFAIPWEVPLLFVAKGAADSSLIDWDDMSPATGTGTHYDVVGGRISDLWRDGDFGAIACVTQDVSSIPSMDGRPLPVHAPGFPGDGWYYLVRSQNACGASDYGGGTSGRRAIDPALCD